MHKITHSEHIKVWTAFDFLDLGNRGAVDKVLQRLGGHSSILGVKSFDNVLLDKMVLSKRLDPLIPQTRT